MFIYYFQGVNFKHMNVWVFNGNNSSFPSGIFSTRELAENFIIEYKLSGVLTLYPLDQSVYDWAISNNFFSIKKDDEKTPKFIQRFSSASQEHFHYENGILE
jgi:hypothetical protein